MRRSRATCLTLAVALAMTGCAHTTGSQHRAGEVVVGSRPGAESVLLADIYTGALRSYGFPARSEQAVDPLTKLDSGAFVVVPGFTGRVLQRFQPGTTVRSDAQVYKAMVGALPEGIVFALSNPDPEIHPDAAARHAAVVATGRSDFPNQINNVLAFPGVFRGALEAGASKITDKMKVAAAEAIVSVVADDLAPDRIVPSPLDPRVAPAGAAAVAAAADPAE